MIFEQNIAIKDHSDAMILYIERYRSITTIFSSLVQSLLPKNTFDFTTAGDWDCVAAVEPLPALHFCVDFIFLPFGIMGFIVEL